MAYSGFLSVSKFVKFSRMTRDALHHYDRIGLLSPALRGRNNYRYYSGAQLGTVNLIRTLQRLGMSLDDIKMVKDNRTPDNINQLLINQIDEINIKIEEWVNAKKLLEVLHSSINSVLDIDEDAITVQRLPPEPIILGGVNDYSRDRNDYDALFSFYESMSKQYPNLNLNYPVWGVYSQDGIRRRNWARPERYYFYNPEGEDERPAALYAVGYARGGYGSTGELYERMLSFIDNNGFEICGYAYEEYPLNEICVYNEENYLVRVMITVREI